MNRTGYTYGVQVVDDATAGGTGVTVGPSPVDMDHWDELEVSVPLVSIPPNTANYTFVTDWGATTFDILGTTLTELDAYLFTPALPPTFVGCSVGFDDQVAGGGNCGTAGTIGTLMAYPFARWFRDGGPTDGLGTEATGIRPPLLTTANGFYNYAVQDPVVGDGTAFAADDANPVARLWKGGVVKKVVRFADHTDAPLQPAFHCIVDAGPGGDSCPWWQVGHMNSAGVFTVDNYVGDDATILPYAADGGMHLSTRRGGQRTGAATSRPRSTPQP
jgi:hypothetical protein